MAFLSTSLIRRFVLSLEQRRYYLSLSAIAEDFNQTQRLANQSHANAQYNLGKMYYNREGVRQSNITAKEWDGKSCDNGQQLGCDKY